MKEIVITPRKLTPALAGELEEMRLVSFIRHHDEKERGALSKDYMKGPDFPATIHGFHSVTISYTDIHLASHPRGQDEIVFNWDSVRRTRPLFYVFARQKRDSYLKRLSAGRVEASDYVAFQAPMNDPRFSAFVVWQGAVHCECTRPARNGTPCPSFYVLEPRRLVVKRTEEDSYGVRLVLGR